MEKPAIHAFKELPPKRRLAACAAMALTIARPLIMADVARRGSDCTRQWGWSDTVQSALSYATDLEGRLARKFNATTHVGVAADPIADKLAMTTHEFALTWRGEQTIPDTALRLFRDLAISSIRRGIKRSTNGEANIGANTLGKVNTATRMTVNILATSPLAEHMPRTVRGLQHASTVLTLASGAFNAYQLLSQLGPKKSTAA